MTVDRFIHAFAGAMILLSLLLAYAVSPHFLWVTAFVGANLFQSAFTGFCPLATILRRVGCCAPPAGGDLGVGRDRRAG
jgi:hypothetical protein